MRVRRQLSDDAHRVGHGRRAVLLERHVRRLGDEILFHEVGRGAVSPGPERRDHRRVTERQRREPREIGCQVACLFRSQVEGKGLDGHRPVVLWVVASEHGAEHAGTNLVDDAVSAECRRR